MSRLISAEYHGEIELKGIVRDVVICYSYRPEAFDAYIGDCYTNKVIKSALLKKRVEEDLTIFMEEQARKDYDRLSEVAYQEHIDRLEYAGDMKCHERMERSAA